MLPEIDCDLDEICKKVNDGINSGKLHNTIIRAEGAPVSTDELVEKLKENTSRDVKVLVLSYLQRGGSPTFRDRILPQLRDVADGYDCVRANWEPFMYLNQGCFCGLFLLAFQLLTLGVHLGLGGVEFVLLAPEFAGLLAKLALLLAHSVFALLDLLVAVGHVFLVVRLHLKILLLGLEDLLLLDVLGIQLGLREHAVCAPAQNELAHKYVKSQGHYGAQQRQDYIHCHIHIFNVQMSNKKQHPHNVQMLYNGR